MYLCCMSSPMPTPACSFDGDLDERLADVAEYQEQRNHTNRSRAGKRSEQRETEHQQPGCERVQAGVYSGPPVSRPCGSARTKRRRPARAQTRYRQRTVTENLRELYTHPDPICHRIGVRAERNVKMLNYLRKYVTGFSCSVTFDAFGEILKYSYHNDIFILMS